CLGAPWLGGGLGVAPTLGGRDWRVVGVAAAIAVVAVPVRLPVAMWLASRRGPVSIGNILSALAPAATAAFAGAAVAWLLRHIAFPAADPTLAGVLTVGGGAALAVVVGVPGWAETR